jgi:hypothetical protein
MALLLLILVEAFILLFLVVWMTLLGLRSTGRLGPRRGRWSTGRTDHQPHRERHHSMLL